MESKDRIPQNFDVLDLSRAMNSFKREQIRKILGQYRTEKMRNKGKCGKI